MNMLLSPGADPFPEDIEKLDNRVYKVGKEAVDAMRGALRDNPCYIDDDNTRIYFSDRDLACAFTAALEKTELYRQMKIITYNDIDGEDL